MRYVYIYSHAKPELIEDDIFKVIIPLTVQATEQVTEQATAQAERITQMVSFCRTAKTTSEIMAHLGLTHREHFRAEILQPLIIKGILHLTIPDKPNSPRQKYYSIQNTAEKPGTGFRTAGLSEKEENTQKEHNQ